MKKPLHRTSDQRTELSTQQVDNFLEEIEQSRPLAGAHDRQQSDRQKLVFALDATASRQSTWDQASSLQSDMFANTRGIGALDIQLAYYRGYRECKASPWLNNAAALLKLMQKITCLAGRTQIERLLKHCLVEAKTHNIQAIVFVGDCVEEDVDRLGDLAGKLKLMSLPVFIFQEGYDPVASLAFAQIARLSGGAHCQFDQHSAQQLGQLLNAVAVYAAGGRSALYQLSGNGSRQASLLLQQLS